MVVKVATKPSTGTVKGKPAKQGNAAAKTKQPTEVQALIDALVQVTSEITALGIKPLLDQQEQLKKTLKSLTDAFPPDQEAVLEGTIGEAIFSACRSETVIVDKAGLIKKLGQQVFNEVAVVKLEDVKKYLSEIEMDKFIEKKPGSRTFKGVKVFNENGDDT